MISTLDLSWFDDMDGREAVRACVESSLGTSGTICARARGVTRTALPVVIRAFDTSLRRRGLRIY
jgi:hypothetical protein